MAALAALPDAANAAAHSASRSHSFDLLSDNDNDDDDDGGDNALTDSASATLKELKKIGNSIERKPGARGSGIGLVDLGAGRSASGAAGAAAASAAAAAAAAGGGAGSEAAAAAAASLGGAPDRGIFIPYGKSVPAMPGVKHYTATGHQECKACQQIISTMYLTGPMFPDLTWGLPPEYKEMGQAQQAVLQACPEFMNNWCYEDLGGTQMLRSPCPAYLTCHYCLGLNPLHCLPEDQSDKVTFFK